ncbi:hypothetical protein BaRGS_00030095 [Batillaria attramentaria]|uniref:Uncharacterized protein n=1 Tax=Batillaria attramentaria TaxID=370345 RepID=A0ABD0JUH6_9CAEN
MWTRHIKHWQRILVAALIFSNGLNPIIFMEWVDLMNLCRDQAARRHFTALFRLFERGEYSRAVYAFDMTNGRYEYLDGSPAYYTNRSQRTTQTKNDEMNTTAPHTTERITDETTPQN